MVGEARSVGLMGALELIPEKPLHRRFADVGRVGILCRDHSFDNGLVMRSVRDTMIVCPPLVISRAEVDELVTRAPAHARCHARRPGPRRSDRLGRWERKGLNDGIAERYE